MAASAPPTIARSPASPRARSWWRVKAETVGSDRGLMRPMLEAVAAPLWPAAETASGRRRLQQQCRHRMGGGERASRSTDRRPTASTGPTLTRRADDGPGVGRMAPAHEQPARQGRLQAARHGRMHQCALPPMGPSPVHRARRRAKVTHGAALVRPRQQHPAWPPCSSKSPDKRLAPSTPGRTWISIDPSSRKYGVRVASS